MEKFKSISFLTRDGRVETATTECIANVYAKKKGWKTISDIKATAVRKENKDNS